MDMFLIKCSNFFMGVCVMTQPMTTRTKALVIDKIKIAEEVEEVLTADRDGNVVLEYLWKGKKVLKVPLQK